MDFTKIARESVAMYETVGEIDLVEVQHLLAVIIGSKKATPEITGKIAGGGLKELINMTVQDLEAFGLSHLDALKVHASILLAKKIKSENNDADKLCFSSPEDCARFLYPKLQDLKQEHLVALYLDAKNQLIKYKTIFIGTLNSSIVHPREVFKDAVRYSAASVIIAHNHPSGDPSPSKEDYQVSRRIVEAGKIMGIEVLDHIVIGKGVFTSIKERGYI